MIVFYNYLAFRKCIGWWGFLWKRQRKSAISKHCQSTYHDTLKPFLLVLILLLNNIFFTFSLASPVAPVTLSPIFVMSLGVRLELEEHWSQKKMICQNLHLHNKSLLNCLVVWEHVSITEIKVFQNKSQTCDPHTVVWDTNLTICLIKHLSQSGNCQALGYSYIWYTLLGYTTDASSVNKKLKNEEKKPHFSIPCFRVGYLFWSNGNWKCFFIGRLWMLYQGV